MQRPPLRKVASLAVGGCAALLATRAARLRRGRRDSDTVLEDELMEERATGEGMPERDDDE
ncbi:MAG TPA: hypothetical protein VID68_01300 [Solirubrobacteraceae bacterium]|jgi:hypothetical protein